MSKFIPALSIEMSPITRSGHPIMSRIGSTVDTETGEIIDGSYQIDGKEALELIKWIDYKMPLLYSTSKLESLAKEMKAELMEIFEAVKESEG